MKNSCFFIEEKRPLKWIRDKINFLVRKNKSLLFCNIYLLEIELSISV